MFGYVTMQYINGRGNFSDANKQDQISMPDIHIKQNKKYLYARDS